MDAERYLESFRIGQQALGIVLPRDSTTTLPGNALPTLPTTIFNWIYGGLKRTELVPDGDAIAGLRHWIEQCSDLDIQPTLLLGPDDRVCSDDQLTDLQQETGVELVWVHAETKGAVSGSTFGKWTQELAVALPDESVVDAYYSQAGDCPISAWPLQSEFSFWIAYGAAIRTWQSSGSYHWRECADMARYRDRRPNSITIPAKSCWVSKSADDLADAVSAAQLSTVDQVVSHRRTPFVFDIRRGTEWTAYGRLPDLSMLFDLPMPQVSVMDEIMQFIKSLPRHFYGSLAAQRASHVRAGSDGKASDDLEDVRVPLAVVKSSDLSIEDQQDFGKLIMKGGRWIVRIPFWHDGIDPADLKLEFLGFLDKTSGRPISKTGQPSLDQLYHLDFTLDIADCQESSDIDRSGVFRLSSKTLEILLAARPADSL